MLHSTNNLIKMASCVAKLTLATSLKTYFELLRTTNTSHTTLVQMIHFWVILDNQNTFFFAGYVLRLVVTKMGTKLHNGDIQESCTFSSHYCENLKFYKTYHSVFMILFHIWFVQIIPFFLNGWIKTQNRRKTLSLPGY